MSNQSWLSQTSPQIVSALRMGGYASFIPCVITQVWNDTLPLAGFPISICFTGLSLDDHREAGSYVVSCYWFDPRSFNENEEWQSMTYRSRCPSEYEVVIAFSKKNQNWEGHKVRGGKTVVKASGTDMTRFVVGLTMDGLGDGEHVEPMLTRTDTASTGIWVYDPALAEEARTGRLQ
jgi:hypothetical protein